MKIPSVLGLFCLIGGLVLAPPWQTPAAGMETEECLFCHTLQDYVGESGLINAQAFKDTDHAMIGCEGCHVQVPKEHPDGKMPEPVSCKNCHQQIHKEYAASDHFNYAACQDCHNPHQALPLVALSGKQMNKQCQQCHVYEDTVAKHEDWVPETRLHLDVVPCITCHNSSDQFAVNLYVAKPKQGSPYRNLVLMGHDEIKALSGQDQVAKAVDLDANGQISMAELNDFYDKHSDDAVRMWPMMTPESVSHDFWAPDNRWNCTFCHAAGPESMENSFVALPQEDGTYQRIPLEHEATLDAVFGVPNFYMVGATRSRTLNLIGLIIILGGFAMPVGHGTLRFLTRHNRRKGH